MIPMGMMKSVSSLLLSFLFAFSIPSSVVCRNLSTLSADNGNLQIYIVHVKRPADHHVDIAGSDGDLESYYRSFLPATPDNSGDHESRLVYSYTDVFSGFAARLTEDELEEMAKKQGFVRAYPNKIFPLLTTHTPYFLGLRRTGRNIWKSSNLGKGVIVGVLDTGINPNHPSFHDDGVPPPPAKWKGECEFHKGCNNKIIGARSFGSGGSNDATRKAPLDEVGHGTHTASTAAGNFVKNVNAFGLGSGTTAGMAPLAHLAIYRICTADGCPSADILAGLDAAVKDGVDVLSLSLGADSMAYNEDPVAIGSFGATEKGIVVVCAAGNDGPSESSLSNEAPWILTVAASTVDRQFRSTVRLGDGSEFYGEALFQPANFSSKVFPLSLAGDIDGMCSMPSGDDLTGKIVFCNSSEISPVEKSVIVKDAGAAGVIIANTEKDGYTLLANYLVLPGSQVSNADGQKIMSYLRSAKNPTASLAFNHTVLGVSPALSIAYFSSRGPNQQSPGILKPDITAPGVNIIAGWNTDADPQSTGFNIISGTSMAAPHVSGIVALIKSLHPDWSPAAIKSAIMTSSSAQDRNGNAIKDERHQNASFYLTGAGHVNPPAAARPGLVYDLGVDDYTGFLCGSGLDDSAIEAIVRRSNVCSKVEKISDSELNYPSITVSLSSGTVTVNRTVTNVGRANAKYIVEVDAPKGVSVTVKPKTLQFSKVNEKQSFSVSVSSSGRGTGTAVEGNLKWVSGKVVVRSPLVIIS